MKHTDDPAIIAARNEGAQEVIDAVRAMITVRLRSPASFEVVAELGFLRSGINKFRRATAARAGGLGRAKKKA